MLASIHTLALSGDLYLAGFPFKLFSEMNGR